MVKKILIENGSVKQFHEMDQYKQIKNLLRHV